MLSILTTLLALATAADPLHRLATSTPPDGPDLLVTAAALNDLPTVQRLLTQGIPPDSAPHGLTPLELTTNPAIASLLLSHGANPHGPHHSNAPLLSAIYHNSPEIIELLLSHGANPHTAPTPHAFSPLEAAQTLHPHLLPTLIQPHDNPIHHP